MKRFLQELFPDGGYIELRCISADNKPLYRRFTASPNEAEKYANEWKDAGHVYFGVIPRKSQAAEKADLKGSPCQVVWVDLDAGTISKSIKREMLNAAIRAFVLFPSVIIDSGRGYHLYWLLDEPIPANEDLEEVVKAVGEKVGGDAVSDIARIMRVPDTLNHKTTPPTPCTIVSTNYEKYSLVDLVAATKVKTKIATKVATGDQRGYRSRSERDWAIIAGLIQKGMSDDGVRQVFQTRKCGDKAREKGGDKYLEHSLIQARGEVKVQGILTSDIVEENDCYWQQMSSEDLVQLSSFVFEPEVLLEGDVHTTSDALLGTVRSAGYEWPAIVFKRDAFGNVSALTKHLHVMAWTWLGGDASVRAILPYLMEKLRAKGLPKKAATEVIGRFKDVWVAPGQTLTRDAVIPATEAEATWLDAGRIKLETDYQLIPEDEYQNLACKIFGLLPLINTVSTIYPVVGWYLAAPWKTRFEARGYRFPSLHMYGTRGSGKTTTSMAMQRLLGVVAPKAYNCDTTRFAMLSLLGATNGLPIPLSEFRMSTLRNPKVVLRDLLLAYDTGEDRRGNRDQSITTYPLCAPISLDGEDLVEDAAMRERMIPINFAPETIFGDTPANQAFKVLDDLPLHLFATRWIMHTLRVEPPLEEAKQLVREAFPADVADRVRRNLVVVVAGLIGLYQYLAEIQVDFAEPTAGTVAQWFGAALDNIVGEYGGRTSILLDDFLTDAMLEIALCREQSRGEPFLYRYTPQTNRLFLHLSSTLSWWYKHRQAQHLPVLGKTAIKTQINERLQKEGYDIRGQYIATKGTSISNTWMFGVDVAAASTVLDVPDKFAAQFQPTIAGGIA